MKNKLVLKALTIITLSLVANIWEQTAVTSTSEAQGAPASRVYQFINGQWFDGQNFKKRTFYAANGVLTSAKPKTIDETIDLAGGYVVPPFGEAHNHSLEGDSNFAQINATYLNAGIFYYKNPNCIGQITQQIAKKINKPDALDAVFAGGGLTATGGHPAQLYDEILNKSAYKFLNLPNLENEAYFIINDRNDLETKWQRILDGKPDFIKTYLLYSEEFAIRRADVKAYGDKGLDPKLLPAIVDRAHRAGLRVSTHVETATDFHNALIAGVDEINHLPGYFISARDKFPQYVISEADARLASQRKVTVVTTTLVAESFFRVPGSKMTEGLLKAIKANEAQNLTLLKKHGVKLAIGADQFDKTALDEAMYLHALKVFTNLELLKMWTETTAQTIFPTRKIGFLKPGYEASFLVLEANPITDFQAVRKIKMRFKRGHIIQSFVE